MKTYRGVVNPDNPERSTCIEVHMKSGDRETVYSLPRLRSVKSGLLLKFEWGEDSNASYRTALAILADCFANNVSSSFKTKRVELFAQRFAMRIVRELDRSGFSITEEDVLKWMQDQEALFNVISLS